MEEILSKIKRIHLIGIGGAGMSALAFLLKDYGFILSGSDIKDSFYFRKVKEAGIRVWLGHNKNNIEGAQLVCASSAIKEDNEELKEAKKRGIPIIRRGELLSFISKDKKVIAIAGSHGKTTTSAMLAYVLDGLGYKPSVFIGAQPLDYRFSSWWGEDFFVVETDESDGSFLRFSPWVTIITNVDREHLDFYGSYTHLLDRFSEFILKTKKMVIGWGDQEDLFSILKKGKSITYGFKKYNKVRADNLNLTTKGTEFELIIEEKKVAKFYTPLLGKHNLLNTLAVLSFFFYVMKEDISKVLSILKNFRNTKRRFQIKENVEGIMFIDDYAHHPTEIKATLEVARIFTPKRLVAIFEPHRYSRVISLMDDFSGCFTFCDVLIVTDIYSASETRPCGFNQLDFFDALKRNFYNKKFYYFPKERLVKEVPSILEEGDLVIGLGAGDISNLLDAIIKELQRVRSKA